MKLTTLEEAMALVRREQRLSIDECVELRRYTVEGTTHEEFNKLMTMPEMETFRDRNCELMELANAIARASKLDASVCLH